mgnify:CR=1 FL=1
MSQVGGQVDALTLTAGEGVGESVERKITQTHIQEELQAVGDFGEQTLADFLLMLREFQFLEHSLRFTIDISTSSVMLFPPIFT